MNSTGTVRNLRFALDDVPRFWHGGRKSTTNFLDGLSLFFPAGERFFVHTVRAHQEFVKDEALAAQVKMFCGQEGVHSREHARYNQLLREQGYPVEELEKKVEEVLAGVMRRVGPRRQLAVTCALEHFTALMGQWLLETPDLLDGAHPAMAALWRWHAAEENEHKDVAFDVFQAAGGTYFERATTMIGATVIFWAKVVEHQVRMMRVDGTSRNLAEWRQLLRFMWIEPGGMARLLPHYLQYFKPGFHPSQIDSRALLDAWKDEFASKPDYAAPRAA
jgi:predicted metal-dependent hydrolase